MSIVYSYSFLEGDVRGDMFFICHGNDTFTIVDCNLADGREEGILEQVSYFSKDKKIIRFISTHPDNDHIKGLEKLIKKLGLPVSNFYSVRNEIASNEDNPSLSKYVELRDDPKSAFITADLRRDFLNQDESCKGIGPSGIHFYWPDIENEKFKKALDTLKNGGKANNISPIFSYSIRNGARFLWMGDLEKDMQEEYYKFHAGEIGKINILFAPHHGRETGEVPEGLLRELNPDIVVIGNAPVEYLKKSYDYYGPNRTITQNSAGDIWFEYHENQIDVYTDNECDNMPDFLKTDKTVNSTFYRGTLFIRK